ncbi:hypothetical protein COV53_06265 [Candidatus Gottesmanbacteria bacterium CG11_big_fil_rev_8_21_14_0_20_37_11]|uniref:BioF2-like acetyltransferase domain-containing protein n=3 Tax=Candidatus Gottesmaniibacteriota TaxID=1752720 RepID=A0A2M7RRB2_9BACT|nr:MAG: hypothetical protein AUJ73_00030 [Candidatus Gottesmanbacteria bacterium CG1_02_37_22]PIP32350.1 MAG: hypothetical protein COX23_05160 [Candidatus Gottesmanbacteria bacterium CG23_combo_of_CG06-09_8_20_14_all_37_19]PIR07820.1 MAG: hypothetical protein COV53_06265 [Candidatus Gottesmanbacteria bacterium CG11_big_fil_rev_8_21_14_0_20_37_11]PIZ02838.1 MAG: hypothetical protein COY59_02655 [Candidatus Gottesmanbacteria bacterium CG_4_10_14_0_8_um_filter_37_24]
MNNLVQANKIISKIAKENPCITPITVRDYALFNKFFHKEPYTYGNSWTYVIQGMYGIGENNLGYKYFDGGNLSAVCVFPKIEKPDLNVFYWIRPMGKSILDVIDKLSKNYHKEHKLPIYVKKIFKEQYEYLRNKGFKNTSNFPWHSSCPSEDDTYPEQILDIAHTIDIAKKLGKTRQLNRSYRYYEQLKKDETLKEGSIYDHKKEAKKVLISFFQEEIKSRSLNISNPYDFYNIVLNKLNSESTIEKIIKIDRTYVAFHLSEIQNKELASLYALISLRNQSNHIVDFLMFDTFYLLLKSDIKFINLGGSEIESLYQFKIKFRPIKENIMYWSVLY